MKITNDTKWVIDLLRLVKSKSPVTRSALQDYTDKYLRHEDELAPDESDTIDALLRILEERVVDDKHDTEDAQ